MLVTHKLRFNQTLWYPCIWRDSKKSWNMYMFYCPDCFEVPLYIYPFIYPSTDRHLGCSYLLIKLLWTFMSACSRVCFSPCFRFFWNKYPRVKLFPVKLLRVCHVLLRDCIILHSYLKGEDSISFLHGCQWLPPTPMVLMTFVNSCEVFHCGFDCFTKAYLFVWMAGRKTSSICWFTPQC